MNDRKLYRWIRVSSLILFMTFASAFAFGDALVMELTSHGSGMFTYAVSDPTAASFRLTSLSLTGLSGVTGATIVPSSVSALGQCAGAGFCTVSFTSSSVTITSSPPVGFSGFFTIGSFVVDSLVPLGTVHYGIQTTDIGNFSGTVGGPSTVPEPTSLLLLGSGVLGLAWMIRGKILT